MNRYKFYGQYKPSFDQWLFENYFPNKRNGTFFEAGALDGLMLTNTKFFEDELGWSGILVEPVPALAERCRATRPGQMVVQTALSDYTGESSFMESIHPKYGDLHGNGSLQHTPEHLRYILDVQKVTLREITVRVMTYNELMADAQLKELDLMILDVEGAELSVLRGMIGAPVLPKVFAIEVNHIDPAELKSLLDTLGYTFDAKFHDNAVYLKQ